MPKKTDINPIVNGLEDSYVVEKSRALMLMKEVPFALGELKVLDTYLSRINARDPDATTVRFSKEEYEDLMGIDRMHPNRLVKYVTSLMGQTVTIPDEAARGGWRAYTLFDEAECGQDENGQWWIDLSCTVKAKKIFFNLENIGYIRYQLKNVLPLTSKHSVLLYIYLLDNRFRVSWDIPLTELRQAVFRCASESYAEFKYFKRDILDKALKEVNEKTDLTFSYEPVRAGRKVTKIKFTLVKDEVTLPLEEDPNQLSLFDAPENSIPEVDDPLGIIIDAIPLDLTREQVMVLRELALIHIPFHISNIGERDQWLYHYITRKVKLLQAEKNVKYPYNWLKKAVEEDW